MLSLQVQGIFKPINKLGTLMMPLISAGRRPSYFQWRGYLASPSRSRSPGEGRAAARTDPVCPGPGPPPWAGGHCHRPWQPTGRRCPKRQPSRLPACRETHENRRQITNNGKKLSAAGCRGRQVTAPACSPYGRDAFLIYREIPADPLEPAPPPLPFQGRKVAKLGATEQRESLGGAGRASQHTGLGQGMAGVQVPAENKICPETASCPSHQQSVLPSQAEVEKSSLAFPPRRSRNVMHLEGNSCFFSFLL